MADETPGAPAIVQQALACFNLAVAAEQKQREREIEDLKFQVPEHQWPDEAKRFRAGFPETTSGDAQTVPPRPMLSISTLDEPIQLVLNQERRAHLGVNIHPLTEEASDDTARVLQDLYRHIEVDSRAHFARGWGYDRAVKAGRGVYRILTEYDPDSDVFGDQKIIIKRVLQQGSVYLDPFATEPDWSDGEWAIVVEDVPIKKYKRLYGESALATASDDDLTSIGNEAPQWVGGTDEASRTVRVGEYFYIVYEATEKTGLDWRTQQQKTIKVQEPRVKWVKFNATEVLDEQDWPGRYIPFVPVIGKELQPFDNERRWVGMIGPAKDGARLTNYAASAAVEMAALEPKAPWLMAEGQDAGFEQEWQQSNVRNWPVLHYRKRDLEGNMSEPPQRVRVDMGRMGPSLELLHMGRDFVQAATATYDPALGKQPTAHRSGRALVALQDQTIEGTSNYLANLAELSIPREALIVLDLIPHFYDRPGRVARVRDEQGKTRLVMFNAPFQVDPRTNRPQQVQLQPGQNPQAVADDKTNPVKHYDLNKGRYGVSVTVGKSYKNRIQEGEDLIGRIIEADPALMPIIGDIWIKYTDVPSKDEISERLRKMQPPQLQDESDPQNAAAMAQQLQQKVQELEASLGEAAKRIDQKQAETDGKFAIAKMQEDAETQRAREANATKETIAELVAKVDLTIAGQKALIDRVTAMMDAQSTAAQREHDATETARARAHEVGLSGQEHANTLEANAQQAAMAPREPSE